MKEGGRGVDGRRGGQQGVGAKSGALSCGQLMTVYLLYNLAVCCCRAAAC